MERKKTTTNEYTSQARRYERFLEYAYEYGIASYAVNGEGLVRVKQDLVELRQLNFGGTIESHESWIEQRFNPEHFGFLYTHKDKVISALIGYRTTLDELSPDIRQYLKTYSIDAPDRPVLWCNNLTTHPDYQNEGLATKLGYQFSEYVELYYRITGAFLACRIRRHNFASEFSFARRGFTPTGIFCERDLRNNNFDCFQYWMKVVPPLYSKEAELFLSPERRRLLRDSDDPYYLP